MGPNVTWYVAVASFLFGIGALGVMLRRSPLIILLVAAVGGVILGSHSRREQWGSADARALRAEGTGPGP